MAVAEVSATVRPLGEGERGWLQATLRERWGPELLVGRGRVRAPSELSALVAFEDGERIGLATYVVENELAELVTIDSFRPGTGVGAALLEGVAEAARAAGARRLLAMTTNDHVAALRFYQRAGFRIAEVRVGAFEPLRDEKPWIPVIGRDGIPLRDEIDLVLDLARA